MALMRLATSRDSSWMLRAILRIGVLGQHSAFSAVRLGARNSGKERQPGDLQLHATRPDVPGALAVAVVAVQPIGFFSS